MPNCKYCGTCVSEDSTFCSNCGKAIIPDYFVYDTQLNALPSVKKEKKGHGVAGLVLSIFALLLSVAYFFSPVLLPFIPAKILGVALYAILGIILLFSLLAFIFSITAFTAKKRVPAGVIGLIFSLVTLIYSGWQIALIVLILI